MSAKINSSAIARANRFTDSSFFPLVSPYTIGAWILLIAFVLCLLITVLFPIHKNRKAYYTAAIVFCAVASLADLIVLAFVFRFAAPIAYCVYHAFYSVLHDSAKDGASKASANGKTDEG